MICPERWSCRVINIKIVSSISAIKSNLSDRWPGTRKVQEFCPPPQWPSGAITPDRLSLLLRCRQLFFLFNSSFKRLPLAGLVQYCLILCDPSRPSSSLPPVDFHLRRSLPHRSEHSPPVYPAVILVGRSQTEEPHGGSRWKPLSKNRARGLRDPCQHCDLMARIGFGLQA